MSGVEGRSSRVYSIVRSCIDAEARVLRCSLGFCFLSLRMSKPLMTRQAVADGSKHEDETVASGVAGSTRSFVGFKPVCRATETVKVFE